MQELCKCLKKGGVKNIHMVAPTNSATDVLRSENFESAQTVAMFLQNRDKLPPKGSYLIIDESGLNSLRQGTEMMKLAMEKMSGSTHRSRRATFSGCWRSIPGSRKRVFRRFTGSRFRSTGAGLS